MTEDYGTRLLSLALEEAEKSVRQSGEAIEGTEEWDQMVDDKLLSMFEFMIRFAARNS